jgi:uncharacterized protein (TIGR03032 family)
MWTWIEISNMAESPDETPPPPESKPTLREVRHEFTLSLGPLLRRLRASLLVTTYQAGKLVVVSAGDGEGPASVDLAYHNFQRAMGVAVAPERLAVGAHGQIWTLGSAPEVARGYDAAKPYDAAYLARTSHLTGEVHIHEVAWSGAECWFVNTAFSCVCTIDDRHSFIPRWKPPFITDYAAEDRCHLNGFAFADGRPRYVTVLGMTDTQGGWRENKISGGALLDVPSGEPVIRGLTMPHSPRIDSSGQLFLLNSGLGHLVVADPSRGTIETVVSLPGYTRGLAIHGGIAFIGLSLVRETATFGGVPIAKEPSSLRCGVAAVELATGRTIAYLQFHTGIEEIFDVQVLPGIRRVLIGGPYPEMDGTAGIWRVASPRA